MPAERIHPADPDPELPPVADLALYAARRVARRSFLIARRLPRHHDESDDGGDVDP